MKLRAAWLGFFALAVIGSADAGQLPIINGQGGAVNMNVQADGGGALSSRIITCDATNPDTCGPVSATGGPTVTPVQATGSNLHMVCDSGCGSSFPADESAFTAGTTIQNTVGGFYQTTATSNPLTNGLMGAVQMTAQRAFFVNLRDSSGNEEGLSAQPLQVSLANTGANGTSLSVTASQATGTNLHMVCDSGCSASSAPADEATFTAGTTPQTPIGGFFQTSPTSNPLTTGKMGAWQFTANRAGFVNLRDSSGNEEGLSGQPLQVSLANTAANGTAVAVSLSGNQAINLAQVNGVTTSTGAGATGTGSQRVGVAQDTTTIAGAAPGTAGAASANVLTVQGVASMTHLLVTPDANAGINLAQVNGVTTLAGAGASGTGAQRVTASQDTTTIAGSAPGTAGTPSTNVVSVQGVASGTVIPENQTQVNSVAILTGAGAVGTGAQRIAVGQDSTTVAGSASLPAGTNSIGAVTASQTITNPTSTLTMPATTTAFTAGQLIANSATAGSVVNPSFAIATSAGGAIISRLRLSTNDSTSTAWGTQTVRVDLWTTTPTWTNGNLGTWSPATQTGAHLAAYTCTMSAEYGDGAFSECAPTVGNYTTVKLASGTSVFWSLDAITGSGVTGVSKVWTLTAELLN